MKHGIHFPDDHSSLRVVFHENLVKFYVHLYPSFGKYLNFMSENCLVAHVLYRKLNIWCFFFFVSNYLVPLLPLSKFAQTSAETSANAINIAYTTKMKDIF